VTSRAGLNAVGWASGVCAGDYDNDGWLDLFITYYGQNVLYRNRGDGRFEDATARAGLPTGGTRWGSGCTFVDYDRDGRADLFVANYLRFDLATAAEVGNGPNCLWKGIPVNCGPRGLPTDTNLLFHNEGNGTFTDVSTRSAVARVTGRYPMTATAADFDGDGWTDIYVACDSTASILYHNNGDGTFTDTAVESGVGYSENGTQQAGMAWPSATTTPMVCSTCSRHTSPTTSRRCTGISVGHVRGRAAAAGLGVLNRYVEWGAGLPDLDNDGRPDNRLHDRERVSRSRSRLEAVPHRGPRIVFRNVDGVRFEDATSASGPGAITPHSSRGVAFGDFDNDGDVDMLVFNMNETAVVAQKRLRRAESLDRREARRHDVQPRSGRRDCAREDGGRTQAQAVLSQSSYYSHDDLRLHFGLGAANGGRHDRSPMAERPH